MTYPPFNPWQTTFPQQNDHNDINYWQKQQQLIYEQQQNRLHAMSKALEFGQLISMRRKNLGLTHDQLASISGVSSIDIIQIESGSGSSINMEKFFAVLSALHINISAYPF